MKNYLLLFYIFSCALFTNAQTITLEAESAALNGTTVVTSPAGYTGTGAVYMVQTGSLTFTATVATAGIYEINLRVNTSLGAKDQDMYVNGTYASALKFPANSNYFDFSAGKLSLKTGANTIEIRASWGWMYFDNLSFTPAAKNDYSKVVLSPINKEVDTKTQTLYKYLLSHYGTNIISGQTSNWDNLLKVSTRTPVVQCFDFQSYTQGYPYKWDNTIGGHTFGWEDNGNTQKAIDWYNSTSQKGIVSFQWHWHSPSGGTVSTNTFYTNKTTFDVREAVKAGTPQNIAILRDIDSIASQLKKLQTAGVPVLWRPLHEAGGAWFWWGAKGSAACLTLWDMVYDRITNLHGLNNLIWVWSTPEESWYPGNSKVDIIGYDSYPGDFNYTTQKAIFDQLFNIVKGEKMVAMTENGPIPNIDNCVADDAMWLYFSSWDNLVTEQNTTAHIVESFQHTRVITLDEVVLPVPQQSIWLEQGWNLFSLNVEPSDNSIATLFSSLDVDVVKDMDNFWMKSQSSVFNKLTAITAGKGYLVKMNAAGRIIANGTALTQAVATNVGWNLIGCQPSTAQPLSKYYNSGNTQEVKNFEGFWSPTEPMSSIKNIESGKGYFLKK